MVYQSDIGPQFQNVTLKCCFLSWRRAAEIFDCLKTFFKPAPHVGMYSLICLKLIRREPKKSFGSVSFAQNRFLIFNLKKLLAIVLSSKKKIFANFQQQQKSFDILKIKTLSLLIKDDIYLDLV